MGARRIADKKRVSQDMVLRILRETGKPLSAYQVMDIARVESPKDDPNEDFAICQRISGACSELHGEGETVCIGKVRNESSGEFVMAYEPANGRTCHCGECPDGGKGYKGRYEQLIATSSEKVRELQGQVDFMAPRIDRKIAHIELLKEQVRALGGVPVLESKVDEVVDRAAAVG